MSKIDGIYEAADDYGLVTAAQCRELGVPGAELVQLAARGRLERVARGVYRIPSWPYQEALPYAVAAKAAGEGAYLFGESVVALLGLAPTSPRLLWVASERRIRRDLGPGIRLVRRARRDETALYDGILCQAAADAVASAAETMGPGRAAEAAAEAERRGYIAAAAAARAWEGAAGHGAKA